MIHGSWKSLLGLGAAVTKAANLALGHQDQDFYLDLDKIFDGFAEPERQTQG